MLLPLVAALFSDVFFPGTKLGTGSYFAIKAFLLFWPFIAVLWILGEPLSNPFAPRRLKSSLLVSVGFGLLLVVALAITLDTKPAAMLLMDHAHEIAMGIEEKGVAMHYIAFAFSISFVNAALEEIYWRWFVFGQLFSFGIAMVGPWDCRNRFRLIPFRDPWGTVSNRSDGLFWPQLSAASDWSGASSTKNTEVSYRPLA